MLEAPAIAHAVRAGLAGRGAARRRGRGSGDRRPGRPAGGRRARGAGDRLQDQPGAAGDAGPGAGRLSAPDGGLSVRCLRQIYPDRPVRCALLWTEGPRLMPLDEAVLASHAPRMAGRRGCRARGLKAPGGAPTPLDARPRARSMSIAQGREGQPAAEAPIWGLTMTIIQTTDASFEADVLEVGSPGGGRLLGRMVRPLQGDRPLARGAGRRQGRSDPDRQGQHRRQSHDARPSTACAASRP